MLSMSLIAWDMHAKGLCQKHRYSPSQKHHRAPSRSAQLHKAQPDSYCLQVLGRGICNGCWNVRSSLQSECGRCKVGACKTCREQWARQRRQGTHANEAGLLVHQANVCFCGAHLTPRGAALYDRKVVTATHTTFLSIAAAPYEHTNN